MRETPWAVAEARTWEWWLDVERDDLNENAYELSLVHNLECEIIEVGDCIRFGPESNLAG
jgi:hypothetical protein